MDAPIPLMRLPVFMAVMETGSFTLAAKRLGTRRSAVSRAIAALETTLGVRLFQRTTRSVMPTVEAERLQGHLEEPLRRIDAALETTSAASAPSGLVRLSVTADIGRAFLPPVIRHLALSYPALELEVDLSSRPVDLVRERFDLALRVSGRLQSSSLVQRKLGTIHLGLFASPSALERWGRPRSLGQLAASRLLGFMGVSRLELQRAGALRVVRSRYAVKSNDMGFLQALAISGAGIAGLPLFLAAADVEAGRLERVLPQWSLRAGSLSLLQASRLEAPSRVTVVRDAIVAHAASWTH